MAGSSTGKTNVKNPPSRENRNHPPHENRYYHPSQENRNPSESSEEYNRNEIPADRFALFETLFSEYDNNDDDDDDDDDYYYPDNPSGSVLQPAPNPYDKEQRIIEANEALFSEPLGNKSPQKVTFSRTERRYSYNSEDLYESDSFTSSDTSDIFVGESRVSQIPRQHHMNTPREGIINSDLLLVLVKADTSGNEEFESEDMCIGIYRKAGITDSIDAGQDCKISDEKRCSHQREETRQKVENIKKESYVEGGVHCDKYLQEIIQYENELTDEPLHDDICKESASGITIKVTNFDSFNSNLISNRDLEKCDKLNVYIPLSNTDCNYEFFENCPLPINADTGNENNINSIEEVEEACVEEENYYVDDLKNEEENKHELQHLNEEKRIETENNQAICVTHKELETEKECVVKDKKESNFEKQSNTIQKHLTKSKVLCHKKVNENDKLIREKISLDLNKKSTLEDNIKARISVYTKSSDRKFINIHKKIMTGSEKSADSAQDKDQVKNMLLKNKSKLSDKSNPQIKNEICCSNNKKLNRPKSCIEKKNMQISSTVSARPFTAPVRRMCCQLGHPRLPEYNGLRSEYGLSAEQLQERKRTKKELMKEKHEHKAQMRIEEEQKRKENEAKFCAWLEGKRQQAKLRYIRNQQIKAASSQLYYAPTGHLKKIGVFPRPKKPLKSETMYYLSLDRLLNSANNGERKTYRIYLGLPVE